MIDPNNESFFLNDETPKEFIQARETLLLLEKKEFYKELCKKDQEVYDNHIGGVSYQFEEGIEKMNERNRNNHEY